MGIDLQNNTEAQKTKVQGNNPIFKTGYGTEKRALISLLSLAPLPFSVEFREKETTFQTEKAKVFGLQDNTGSNPVRSALSLSVISSTSFSTAVR